MAERTKLFAQSYQFHLECQKKLEENGFGIPFEHKPLLKFLSDGYEKTNICNQEKLNQRIAVKKRVEKENSKFLKIMRKQFNDHVAVLEGKEDKDQKEF